MTINLPVELPSEQKAPKDFERIQFKGNPKDYFSIWISNLFLSIVTLGVYSAWAKVRRTQYFYGHTFIAEYSLGYHANGKQILVGRAIAIVCLISFTLLTNFFPESILFAYGVLLFVLPWIINRSLRFRARMTSWRNVRLNWQGEYWKTLLYFIVYPILGIISLGLFMPVASKHYYEHFSNNHAFGVSKFHSKLGIGPFYQAFALTVYLAVAAYVLLLALLFFFLVDDRFIENLDAYLPYFVWSALLLPLMIVLGNVAYFAFCRNILMRNLELSDKVSFKSDLDPLEYLWIVFSNMLAIVFSLGFLIPWAAIRKYRYLCEHTSYLIIGDESKFIDEEAKLVHSFGEEFADLEGFEITV